MTSNIQTMESVVLWISLTLSLNFTTAYIIVEVLTDYLDSIILLSLDFLLNILVTKKSFCKIKNNVNLTLFFLYDYVFLY